MKRLLIGKILGIIGILIFTMGISYIFTFYLEKNNFQDVNLLVTFEDTEVFSLENLKKLEKEAALETYPYIFQIENKGKSSVDYEIKIIDKEITNLERKQLNYVLYLNNEEIKSGNLGELKDNLLYNTKINKKKTDIYKLYIYLNEDLEDITYKYQLQVNFDG